MLSPQRSNQLICQEKKILAFQDFIGNTYNILDPPLVNLSVPNTL